MSNHLPIQTRWLIRRDMYDVCEIEQLCYGELAWDEECFLETLRNRRTIGMIAEYRGNTVGYFIYDLHKYRLHIVNIAVHPKFQRKHIGQQMIRKLKNKLTPNSQRIKITARCGEGSLAVQLFLRSQQFLAKKIERDYYPFGESAYLFDYTVPLDDRMTSDDDQQTISS
jgi:ribosomal-protein-alanine N-acetyltransferase